MWRRRTSATWYQWLKCWSDILRHASLIYNLPSSAHEFVQTRLSVNLILLKGVNYFLFIHFILPERFGWNSVCTFTWWLATLVSFVKFGAVKGILFLTAWLKFCSYFLYYIPIRIEFRVWDLILNTAEQLRV